MFAFSFWLLLPQSLTYFSFIYLQQAAESDADDVSEDIPDHGFGCQVFPGTAVEYFAGAGAGAEMDGFSTEALEELSEIFTNGLGLHLESSDRFTTVIETPKRRKNFLDSGEWCPSSLFQALPFIWQKPRHGRPHHFADVLLTNAIIATELGFQSPIAYIESRGWVISKLGQSGRYHLEYRKLEEVLAQTSYKSSSGSTQLCTNVMAMIEHIYKMLEDDGMKHVYTGKPAVRLLDKSSFVAKVNNHAQDLHVAVILVKHFFLDHVPDNKGNLDHWTKKLFRQCSHRKDFVHFCNNIFSLFPEEKGDADLATRLLTRHADCMKDEVARLAASEAHRSRYRDALFSTLDKNFKRGTGRSARPSPERLLVMCRCRARDSTAQYLASEERESFQSLTRGTRNRKSSGNNKKKRNIPVESLNTPPPLKKRQATAPAAQDDNSEQVNITTVPTLQQFAARPVPAVDDDCTTPAHDPDNDCTATPPSQDMADNSWLGDLNKRFDPAACRPATDAEVRHFKSRLVIFTDKLEHQMHGGSMEYYLVDKLKHRTHGFENGSPIPNCQTNSRVIFNYPQGVDHLSDDVSVVRGGSNMFQKHFNGLRLCPATLVKFVISSGASNAKRDGDDAKFAGIKRRITFGCCGQSFTSERVNGFHAPKSTYGLDALENIENDMDRRTLKQSLASALDCMQDCEDEIEVVHLSNPMPFNHPLRTERFGKQLRESIGAKRFRREDVTIQVKCISRNERTANHTDDLNCNWITYTKTSSLCLSLVDALGDIWSVKIVTNSRAKAGNFFDSIMNLVPILTRIQRQMESLNHAYESLVLAQRSAGGHQYPEKLTAKMFKRLVLDDFCPWEEVDIGNGMLLQRLEFPAATVRDIHLSAPTTVVYQHHQQVNDPARSIMLALSAAYMTGYHRFYCLGCIYDDLLASSSTPHVDYYKKAMHHFRVPFGDIQVGRINPSGVDFSKVYMNEDGTSNGVMEDMASDVHALLDWINNTVGTDDFHHVSIEQRFRSTLAGWKDKCYDTDIGEFRLMIAVQILILAGVVVKGHNDLHNLVYPVSNLGAAKQLAHIKAHERPAVLHRIITEMDIEEYGTNAAEGSLCETSENRVCRIKDYVFKDQIMFTIGKNGEHLLKRYNSDTWEGF